MILEFSLSTAMLAAGLASAVLTLALLYLSAVPAAPPATRWWAAGFALHTARYLVRLCGGLLTMPVCDFLAESLQASAAVLLIAGALRHSRPEFSRRWVAPALVGVTAWAALFTLVSPHFLLLSVPLYGVSGLAMLYAGWTFIRSRPGYARSGYVLVGATFMVWGLHKLDYSLLRSVPGFAPLGFIAAEVLTITLAVGLILVVQRRQQHLAEEATRRAQASEARLQASEARYRDLIDNSVLGICIHREGTPLYVNPAFLRIFGFSSFADVAGRDVIALTSDPAEVPHLRALARARLRGEAAPEHFEFRGRRADGTPLWLHNWARVITWQGEPAAQAILVDITEQKRAGEELQASQRLLRTVMDSMPHVVIVRNRQGRIVMANRTWQRLFGLDGADYLHKKAPELAVYDPEDAALVQEASLRVVATERPMQHEHSMRSLEGHRRFHTVRTPLRGEEGQVVGVVSISLDITEQRAMEEQLRQAQKMEAVGQLTGGVAHDFNNLLGIITGNLELLEHRIPGDNRAQDSIRRAMRATERGAALTQRLLAFSRRQTLQPQPVQLARQVDDVLELLRSSLGETIRIETACDPAAGRVHVDPAQFENTLLNLALNARDAMPTGGRLSIAVEAATDRTLPGFPVDDAPSDWVVLTVRDTGQGMPPDVLGRAVEPFFTTKEAGSGSGLGLSMIYGFMNQSGGHLHIQSEPGIGTTVRLYFRRAPGEARERPPAEAPAPPRGTAETVLVVEDDPTLGQLAVEMLAALNYTAILATDGHEALRALRDNAHVGLLFTDVVLPGGMDGVELAEEARRLRPGLKVLFTSGYAETVFARHPNEIEGTDLVQKPYRLGELALKLGEVLGHAPPPPERAS